MVIQIPSTPLKVACSSPSQLRLYLSLGVLLLFCLGLFLASGWIAIKASFQPSEQLRAQNKVLELRLKSEYPPLSDMLRSPRNETSNKTN